MDTTLKLFLFFSIIFISGKSLGQNKDFSIAPVPEWIVQQIPEHKTPDTNSENSLSSHYLLVNRQENISSEQLFIQYSIKVLNAEGLQEVSDISIDFDPSYQELVFHSINVIRGTEVTNHLTDSSIKIVQRETSLERHIYDGRLTAVINLKDMRVGDIIDYSYSIIGYNPVFKGHYSRNILLQYSVPIKHIYVLLIAPDDKKLQFQYSNGAEKPKENPSSNGKTYVWEQRNVPVILYENNTPSWYDPYPRVFISDYPTWESIVNWGLELFSLSETEENQLKESIAGLLDHQSVDSAIIQAIRFTQDEIRYLGFTNGLNSHKPHTPTKVLTQRYGDCKDKSFLLSEILKICGIDASPVLVHSRNGHSLENILPSPDVFNHCVVQFNKNGRIYYIDPTISNQGGDLKHYYFPNFHKGLVIKEGESSLVDLPLSSYTGTKVKEIFTLEGIEKGASLHVSTTYSGTDADYQRQYFERNNIQTIQKNYVDFYSALYPQIKVGELIKVADQRDGNNTFTVEEVYSIDSFWSQSEEERQEHLLYCEFYPLSLESYISVANSPNRTMPYRVGFPVDFEHETVINLPEEWPVENETKNIANESFVYSSTVINDNDKIRLFYKYKTLKEYISPDKAVSFIAKHDNILNDLSFHLTYDKGLDSAQFKFSWPACIFVLFVLVLSSYLSVRIFHGYDIPVTCDSNMQKQIGGWLILVAIGLTITPLRVCYDMFNSPEFLNSNVWNSLIGFDTSTRNLLTGLLIIVETLYNFTFLVFSLLVVFLFYNRRTILPRFAIILFSTALIFLIIDTSAAFTLNPQVYTASDRQASYKEITRELINASIWIPYFIYSKRVRHTFVKTH